MRIALMTAGLAMLTVACGAHYFDIYRAEIAANQQGLQNLRLGMSSDEVLALMGEGEVVRYKKIHLVDPWRTEGFALVDGTDVLLLYYLTQPPRKYYRPSDEALTPIVLEDDRVVGWGWSFLRRKSDRYQISTPREQR